MMPCLDRKVKSGFPLDKRVVARIDAPTLNSRKEVPMLYARLITLAFVAAAIAAMLAEGPIGPY
jgi:hypothetical protein